MDAEKVFVPNKLRDLIALLYANITKLSKEMGTLRRVLRDGLALVGGRSRAYFCFCNANW